MTSILPALVTDFQSHLNICDSIALVIITNAAAFMLTSWSSPQRSLGFIERGATKHSSTRAVGAAGAMTALNPVSSSAQIAL